MNVCEPSKGIARGGTRTGNERQGLVIQSLPAGLINPTFKAEAQAARIGLSQVVNSDTEVVGRSWNRHIGCRAGGTRKETKHGFNGPLIDGETEGVLVIAAVRVFVLVGRVEG